MSDEDEEKKPEPEPEPESDPESEPEADADDAWDPDWDPDAEMTEEDPDERAARIAAFEAAVEKRARKVKRIVGCFMSVLVPGTGHFAVGRPQRGVFWFVVALLSTLLLPISVELFIAGLVGSVIATIVDLIVIDITAKKTPEWIAIALIWFGALLVAQFVRGGIFDKYAGGFHVPSPSMVPNILRGDSIVVYKRDRGSVGDVVVFTPPCSGKKWVRRIVATAGDKVAVRCGKLFVNGADAAREAAAGSCSYHDFIDAENKTVEKTCVGYRETHAGRTYGIAFSKAPANAPRDLDFPTASADGKPPTLPACEGMTGVGTIAPAAKGAAGDACAPEWHYVVPDGHVFVLGDNRDEAIDSRQFGAIRKTAIDGKVTEVWWSTGPSGLRLGRVGKNVP